MGPRRASSKPSLANSYPLAALPPGLYNLYPEPGDVVEQLKSALARDGQSCVVFPDIIADYLVADTVRREIAFDLENRGVGGTYLSSEVDRIVQRSPLRRHGQSPRTLSGGEQQLLAVTTALQHSQPFLLGRDCFDFVSDQNIADLTRNLIAQGKRMLAATYRNNQPWWRLRYQNLELILDRARGARPPSWRSTLPAWNLEAIRLVKQFETSGFRLDVPRLELSGLQCLGVHGDNGSGKSTFADCMTALIEFSGEVRVSLKDTPAARWGYLVQQVSLPTQGIRRAELIGQFVQQRRMSGSQGERLERFAAAAPYYGQLAELDARVGFRLIVIAALLLGDYDILLLDEPSYGMPAIGVAEFLVQAMADLGPKPLVIISHDRNFLTLLCDTIIELERGSLRETGV